LALAELERITDAFNILPSGNVLPHGDNKRMMKLSYRFRDMFPWAAEVW